MAELKLIGAVGVKVRPDTSDFRKETKRGVEKQLSGLNPDVTVEANPELNKAAMREALADAKRMARDADVNLKIDVDKSSFGEITKSAKPLKELQQELKQLEAQLDHLKSQDGPVTGQLFTDLMKTRKAIKSTRQEIKELAPDIAAVHKEFKKGVKDGGFKDFQNIVDKNAAAMERVQSISKSYGETVAFLQAQLAGNKISADRRQEMELELTRMSELQGRLRAFKAEMGRFSPAEQDELLRDFTAQDNVRVAEDQLRKQERIQKLRERFAAKSGVILMRFARRWAHTEEGILAGEVLRERKRQAVAEKALAANKRQNEKLADFYDDTIKSARDYVAEQAKLAGEEVKVARDRYLALRNIGTGELNNQLPSMNAMDANLTRRILEDRRVETEKYTKAIRSYSAARLEAARAEAEAATSNKNWLLLDAISQEMEKRIRERALEVAWGGAQMEEVAARWASVLRKNTEEARFEWAKLTDGMESQFVASARTMGEGFHREFLASLKDVDLDPLVNTWAKALRGDNKAKVALEGLKVGLDERSLKEAKDRAEKLRQEIDQMEAHIAVNPAGIELAAARFMWLTRPRTVTIFAKVNEKSLAIAEGALMGLAGLNVAQDVGRKFSNIFENFDQWALKVGKISTVIGSLAGVVGSFATSLLTVGAGVLDVIGLSALLPTAFMTASAGMFVFRSAFNNFFESFNDIPFVAETALGKLPPLARKAVEELRGEFKGLSNPVQDAFWAEMGDSIGQLKDRILPDVKRGLMDIAPAMGKFSKGVLDSFTEIADDGQLDFMFKNMSTMFENASGAAKPFFDAFNTLGVRGSRFLPEFGTWLTDIATQFDNFITKSEEAGDIDRWIREGVQSLKDMWSIGGSVIDMFGGLAKAAGLAGAPTLTEWAEGLRGIADQMNAEPFQGRMSTLFLGAREGAEATYRGVKDLGRAVAESAPFWAEFMIVTGEIAGLSMSNLSRSLRSVKLQDGVLESFAGLREFAEELRPSFDNVARIVGNIGILAGSVFRNLAPIFNAVTGEVADLSDELAVTLAQVSPLLIQQVAGSIVGLGTAVGIIATAANNALKWFLEWPGVFQQIAIAGGAFLLLKGQIGGVISAFTATDKFKGMRREWVTQKRLAGESMSEIKKYGAGTVIMDTARTRVSNFTGSIKEATTATTGLRKGWAGAKVAGRGLFDLMGGGWGVALMGATTLLALHAQEQAKAKQKIDEMAASLDSQTGELTKASDAVIAKNLQVKDSFAGVWEVDGSSAIQLAEKYGIELDELTAAAAGSDEALAKVQEQMNLKGEGPTTLGSIGTMMRTLGKELGPAGMMFGVLGGAMAGAATDGDKLNEKIGAQRKIISAAKEQQEQLALATGVSSEEAGRLSEAFAVMGDDASTASERVAALKTQIDILKDGALSTEEAARNFAREWEGVIDALEAETTGEDGVKKSLNNLVDAKGAIKDFEGAGGVLYDSVQTISDAMLLQSQSAYKSTLEQTGSHTKAQKAALAELKLAPAELEAFADAAGISTEKAKLAIDHFFAEDWEMKAMFSADAELFWNEAQAAEKAGQEFGQKEWAAVLTARDLFNDTKRAVEASGEEFNRSVFKAYLAANPDPAKRSVEGAVAFAEAFAADPYKATLDAMDKPAKDAIARAAKKGKDWSDDDYEAWLKALDKTNPGLAASVRSIRATTKSPYSAIIAALNRTGGGISDAKTDLSRVPDKKTTISASWLKAGSYPWVIPVLSTVIKAVWGAPPPKPASFSGSASKFADGGILAKVFADGGIENHVAQISYPSSTTPIRIWSEPETQGEAYIPLSSAKRTRSLQIWEETGRLLGAKAYANGGIEGGGAASNAPVFNINNHYPVAEPTSTTVNRALQYGAFPGMN